MLYWLPATATSLARLYWENAQRNEFAGVTPELPMGASIFPKDLATPPRIWAERAYPSLIYFREVERGGHFAAFEQPALFVRELRDYFRLLRGA